MLRPKRMELINLKSPNLLNLHHLNGLNPMHQSKRPPKITTVRSNLQVLLFQRTRKTKTVLPRSRQKRLVRLRREKRRRRRRLPKA